MPRELELLSNNKRYIESMYRNKANQRFKKKKIKIALGCIMGNFEMTPSEQDRVMIKSNVRRSQYFYLNRERGIVHIKVAQR